MNTKTSRKDTPFSSPKSAAPFSSPKSAALAPISLCLLCSLLLTACAGLSPAKIDAQAEQIAVPLVATWKAGAPPPTGQPTHTPPPPTEPTPTHTPPPTAANLAASQVLNLAECCSGADFYKIDPALAWGGAGAQIATEAFVGLTRQNEETAEVEPGMATSWDITDHGRVWTFQLRTDVPWVRFNPAIERIEKVTDESGEVRTVTAQDFKYGIERVLDPETKGANRYLLFLIEGAEAFNAGDGPASAVGVTALDEATLEIRLVKPASYFDVIANLWTVVAHPAWQIEALGEDWTETGNFQGYGPYVLKEWVHDSHITMVKNPYWPGTEGVPQATVEEITWTLMDDAEALVAAYQAGDLDVIEIPQDTLASVQANSKLTAQLAVQPNLCTYYYGFNTQKPPFDDPAVRRAFSLAIDRQALIDEAVQGNQEPAQWLSRPAMRAAPTVEETPALGVTYSPEDARELLDQAYPDRSQMPPITLAFNAFGQHEAIAEVVRDMWAATLDVEVQLEPIKNFTDYLDLLESDAPQVWRMGWCPSYADAHGALGERFRSGADNPTYTNWSSALFDELVDQAAVSTDTAERGEWYAQAEDLLVNQEAVIIPLYWYTNNSLTQPSIQRTYSGINGIQRFEKWAVVQR